MSRRRVNSKYVPITISLKPSMVAEIEEQLSYKQSRSAWIANAIYNELDDGEWSVVRDGNAYQMFCAFKQKMLDEQVQLDAKLLEIIESTVKNCSQP